MPNLLDMLSQFQMPESNSSQEMEMLKAILGNNEEKNFVQRIINPYIFPYLNLDSGSVGSHMMSYSTGNNGAIAYPEIIQDINSGNLHRLGREEAYDYAMKTGEYIPFTSSEEADWFSKNYKKVWNRR